MKSARYYISFLPRDVLIVRKKKRTKDRIYTDLLFTFGGDVHDYYITSDFTVLVRDWDTFFKEPKGIEDKKEILQAMGI